MSAHRPTTIVYVASSARSGSTILDMMLGAHPRAFSLGQLDQLEDWVRRDDYCTCGETLGRCRSWSPLLGSAPGVGDALVPPMLNVEGQSRKGTAIVRGMFSTTNPRAVRAAADRTWDLLSRVARETDAQLLVDSSKTLLRLERLDASRPPGADLRVVHLVRDLRGVVASRSYTKPAPNAAFEVGYTPADPWHVVARDWWVQNLLSLGLGVTRFRGRYLAVTYEQLVARPETELRRITRFLGIGYDASMLPPLDRAEFHLIGGNSSRLTFDRLKVDDSWKQRLPRGRRWLLAALQWPLYRMLSALTHRRPTAHGSAPSPPGTTT